MEEVRTIDREELRQKLARNDDFKLVMALSAWQFQHKRIPGSIHFDTPEAMLQGLRKDDEIVVYCSQLDCKTSVTAYHLLVNNGYTRVRRYAAGLSDWQDADLPLEGSWTAESSTPTTRARS